MSISAGKELRKLEVYLGALHGWPAWLRTKLLKERLELADYFSLVITLLKQRGAANRRGPAKTQTATQRRFDGKLYNSGRPRHTSGGARNVWCVLAKMDSRLCPTGWNGDAMRNANSDSRFFPEREKIF